MSEPLELFDASRVVDAVCPVCGALRPAGEPRAVDCQIDRDRDAGAFPRRPAGCLNAIDPAHAPFPEGF